MACSNQPHPDDCTCGNTPACRARRRAESDPPRTPPKDPPKAPPMDGQDPKKRR